MYFRLIEENELEQRAKKHAKKQKGLGYFVNMNAGNVEYNKWFFNHAMGSDKGQYDGPDVGDVGGGEGSSASVGGEGAGEGGGGMGESFETEERLIACDECGKKFHRNEMEFSKDCYGIPFRLLCVNCLDRIYQEKGYDGEYYTPYDENIEWDY